MTKFKHITLIDESTLRPSGRQKIAASKKILRDAATRLKLRFPQLGYALSRMEHLPVKEKVGISTDGRNILYNPDYVLSAGPTNHSISYGRLDPGKQEIKSPDECLLHIVLHGLLGHFDIRYTYQAEQKIFFTLMDCQVNLLLRQMTGSIDDYALEYVTESEEGRSLMTSFTFPHDVYMTCLSDRFAYQDIRRLTPSNEYDNHYLWYLNDEMEITMEITMEAPGDDRKSGEETNQNKSDEAEGFKQFNQFNQSRAQTIRSQPGQRTIQSIMTRQKTHSITFNQDSPSIKNIQGSSHARRNKPTSRSRMNQSMTKHNATSTPNHQTHGHAPGKNRSAEICGFWAEAANYAGINPSGYGNPLQKLLNDFGYSPGDTSLTVSAAEGPALSYHDLLHKFIHITEGRREDPESLDIALYQYGLELYGDVPIVEPAEESFQNSLGTLIIAIDTSGSCYGDTASVFLRETRKMLSDIEETGTFKEIHILECDTRIVKAHKFKDVAELKQIEETMQFHGYGGTDFCPVFKYADKLEKEGNQVEALIYLTDSEGSYPKKERRNTYFVMERKHFDSNDKPNNQSIPNWITPVKLE